MIKRGEKILCDVAYEIDFFITNVKAEILLSLVKL